MTVGEHLTEGEKDSDLDERSLNDHENGNAQANERMPPSDTNICMKMRYLMTTAKLINEN